MAVASISFVYWTMSNPLAMTLNKLQKESVCMSIVKAE